MTRYTKLRQMEVVNILDGARLGYLCDLVIDMSSGKVCGIVVPGPFRFSFLFKGRITSYNVCYTKLLRMAAEV